MNFIVRVNGIDTAIAITETEVVVSKDNEKGKSILHSVSTMIH